MQENENSFNRRRFLQWSAAGAGALLPLAQKAHGHPQQSSTIRSAPVEAVTLRGPELEITLDTRDGLPYEYHLPSTGARLRGETLADRISVTLCRKDPWNFATVVLAAVSHRLASNSVEFQYNAQFAGSSAALFSLRYALQGTTVVLTLENVLEQPGYELIAVSLPSLVTVLESDGPAWLAHGDQGGSLAILSEANEGTLPPNSFWGNILGTLPVVMVGTAQALCVQETTAYMDGTCLGVSGTAGQRRASLGTTKVYRVNGGRCYDLNLGRGIPSNCGNRSTPNLLVEQKSSCRLDFLSVRGKMEDAWLDAAKLVRSRMPAIPTHFYDDKFIYGIRCDEPRFPKPAATFAQCEQLIGNVAELIDQSPQLIHLWGWQFHGKDTGYPAVNEVNERLGGYDAMMQLMQGGKKANATITISDNYDDAYRSSPAWSDSIIARRPDGQLWKSRSWTGEESYILGLSKYMAGPGMERIRYTCERYRLPGTTHVDVLSYYAIRNDWDPEHPASGIRNLLEGRYRVLDTFKAHGVDVSSEALRYPMIGHISCFWYAQGPAKCPFGGKRIPLLPLVFRKSAVWGLSGGHEPDPEIVRLNEVFLGATPRPVGLNMQELGEMVELFYLWMVPWLHIHHLNIESFHRTGERVVLGLENDSSIEIDWAQKAHRIVLIGHEVARQGQIACPLDSDRLAFYALEPQTLSAPLPAGWSAREIGAVTLSLGKREAAPADVKDGEIRVRVTARQPVIVYRKKSNLRLTVASAFMDRKSAQ